MSVDWYVNHVMLYFMWEGEGFLAWVLVSRDVSRCGFINLKILRPYLRRRGEGRSGK